MRNAPEAGEGGKWWRLALITGLTGTVIVPIVAVLFLSLQPMLGSRESGPTLENYVNLFTRTNLVAWLSNSLIVAFATVGAAVVLAAPAGYVISRARGRLVSGFALGLFIIQSLPLVTALIPLFVLFARIGLIDNLVGIVIIHVGSAVAVGTWMMASYFDTIPIALEEAAWIDGATVFGAFRKVVLPNSLPGVLSTAIFTFLMAWNDFIVALVFLRSNQNFTLALGLQTFFQQNVTDWGPVSACATIMMIPPLVIFAVLNKYFSLGGIGGSLAGR